MMQGLSGRPAFNASDRASAEDFFLESLNAWRVKQGIKDKFILVGHSLGGCGHVLVVVGVVWTQP
jgi:pimeloyl-ACP methyl ester carboxylesterase